MRIRTTLSNNAQEARSLQFFDEKTLTQLQAFFPDELWSKSLPQIAYSHSSVRHALVALSAYHERYVNRQSRDGLEDFTASQYSLAVKALTGHGAESSWQIHLISCLIFICIEVTSLCTLRMTFLVPGLLLIRCSHRFFKGSTRPQFTCSASGIELYASCESGQQIQRAVRHKLVESRRLHLPSTALPGASKNISTALRFRYGW